MKSAREPSRSTGAPTSVPSQHTPGPWFFDERPDHAWCVVGSPEEPDGGDIVCEHPEGAPESMAHWAANARLIAAAPDLLEALDEAPILSKYHGASGFELERFIADYEGWHVKRRAAISRTEGK